MDVTQEVLDRFISDPFLDPSDDTLIDNALTVMREQGLDLEALGIGREELRRRIMQARTTADLAPERLPVQPQAHRQVLRTRLVEQTRGAELDDRAPTESRGPTIISPSVHGGQALTVM
jgi:hypothetical protein